MEAFLANTKNDRHRMKENIKGILEYIGENPNREKLGKVIWGI